MERLVLKNKILFLFLIICSSSFSQMKSTFNGLSIEDLHQIGGTPFNMTVAAFHLCRAANGVAQLHTELLKQGFLDLVLIFFDVEVMRGLDFRQETIAVKVVAEGHVGSHSLSGITLAPPVEENEVALECTTDPCLRAQLKSLGSCVAANPNR